MENKKNTNNIKEKINKIDSLIDKEKDKIKKYNDIQEEVIALHKTLNNCIELLSKSIKGPTKANKFNDMFDKNKSIYVNYTSEIEEQIDMAKKNINKLNQEKDDIIKENKNKKE